MKRILSFFLTLVLTAALLCPAALAVNDTAAKDRDWVYITLDPGHGGAGAGGLGDFAIRYGHDRNMADITNVTVLVLVLIVCVIEFVGGRIVKKNTH